MRPVTLDEAVTDFLSEGADAFVQTRQRLDDAWSAALDRAVSVAAAKPYSDADMLSVLAVSYQEITSFSMKCSVEFQFDSAREFSVSIRPLNAGYRARFEKTQFAECTLQFGIVSTPAVSKQLKNKEKTNG